MRILYQSMLLSLAAVAGVATAQSSDTPQKKLYCWNDGGRRICSDALPASAVNSARTEISSKTGLRHAEIGRALNDEERAAQRALEAEQLKEAADRQAQNRADMALAESYQSEAELRRAFQVRYDLVDEALKTSKMAIDNQRQTLLRLLQAAADLELQGQAVPARLADDVLRQREAFVDAQRSRQIQQESRLALDAQLVEALARWRRVRGLEVPAASANASPPTTPATPASVPANRP